MSDLTIIEFLDEDEPSLDAKMDQVEASLDDDMRPIHEPRQLAAKAAEEYALYINAIPVMQL